PGRKRRSPKNSRSSGGDRTSPGTTSKKLSFSHRFIQGGLTMRTSSLQLRSLAAATLALACSAPGLIAQERPDNRRQAAEKTPALTAQQKRQSDPEISGLRDEIRALRKD